MGKKTRHREEVINVKFADELAARGLDADAETIEAKGRPDVLVDLSGIKLVIEGRNTKAKTALIEDAKKRIQKGIGEISLAIFYPEELYFSPSNKLGHEIGRTAFSGSVLFYRKGKIAQNAFSETSIDDLADVIRNVVGLIVRDDVVADQVEKVELAIENCVLIASSTNLFFKSATVREKLKSALAIDF